MQARFCGEVRQALLAALQGRVPPDRIRQSAGLGVGFSRQVDAFTADRWRAENLETGERRLFIPRFEAAGSVRGNAGAYSSAADALKQNWPEFEAAIVRAAAEWFQENIGALPPEALAGQPRRRLHTARPGWEGWPALFQRELARQQAIHAQQEASEKSREAADSLADPVETLRFRTYTDLAAWARNQAALGRRQL